MARHRPLLTALLSLVLALSLASGQDSAKKKFTPRLPPYYSDIVSLEQRQEIYELQSRYAEPIASLQAQLAELTRERDAQIEAVLTSAQRQRLHQARENAASKRRPDRALPASEQRSLAASRC